jgi:hypothetical protein
LKKGQFMSPTPPILQCLFCPAILQPIMASETLPANPASLSPVPQHGVIVQIAGNPASKVYPAIGNEHLRAVICDKCLRAKGARGLIRRVTVERPVAVVKHETWAPAKPEWFTDTKGATP